MRRGTGYRRPRRRFGAGARAAVGSITTPTLGAIQAPILAAFLAATLAAGCATRGAPGDPSYPYNLRGAYSGRLIVDGRAFDGALSARTAGDGSISGTLRIVAPFSIDGTVRGRIIDDLVRLTVTWRGQTGCEGRIEGILTVEAGGDVVDGPVTIHDCGAILAGRLSFRR